jgi:hypothetical protein
MSRGTRLRGPLLSRPKSRPPAAAMVFGLTLMYL